jgi:hypothetical protein
MTIRFCGACGTEIDETAAFCPSCGRPLDDDRPAMKPPPTWDEADETRDGQQTVAWTRPAAEAADEPAEAQGTEPPDEPEPEPEPEPALRREPETADERPSAGAKPNDQGPPSREPAPATSPSGRRSGRSLPSIAIPVSWPVTLSGWLIGIGALVGVIAFFLPWTIAPAAGFLDRWGLTSATNLLLLAALVAIAISVFFSAHVPDFAHRRLAILVVVLIGLGVGLDRLGIGAAGSGAVLFFLAMLAATIGALLVEVGADRPLSGPGT